MMKTCEGDFIETAQGLIFDVKGLIHPPNLVIAFIRYFPSKEGKRKRDETTYGKVYSLSKRYALLRKRFQQYLVYDTVFDETLCEVPIDDVKKLHRPVKKLLELRGSRELDLLECKALQLAELLKEKADIPLESIGISGSILVGLHTPCSDVDPIVYGSRNCMKAHSALEEMFRSGDGLVKPYTQNELRTLFEFRSEDSTADLESFVRTESRKVMQGKFMGVDFFVRFVKDWSEIVERYGDVQYRNEGYARIKAKIVEDSESIFTPCKYRIEDVAVIEGIKVQQLDEIASFRGRFCEQARVGEVVAAQGKVERVIDKKHDREYFRLLLGNKPSDFMTLA
jgi:predicted nucleotidyltransferase